MILYDDDDGTHKDVALDSIDTDECDHEVVMMMMMTMTMMMMLTIVMMMMLTIMMLIMMIDDDDDDNNDDDADIINIPCTRLQIVCSELLLSGLAYIPKNTLTPY